MSAAVRADSGPIVAAASRPAAAPGRLLAKAADLLFVLPLLALIGVFILLPSLLALGYSFTNWDPGYSSPWVGLANYQTLFADPTFHKVVVNEAVLLIGIPVWLIVPLIIATLLHGEVRGAGVFRSIYFFPAVLSPAILGILFSQLLKGDGAINQLLRHIGLGVFAGNWLSNPSLVKFTIIAVVAWASMGTGVVIFSSALSALPVELFEVAEIDGAGWWQRFRYVVIPGLLSTVRLYVVLLVITVFIGLFPWIFTLTQGGPSGTSTTVDYDIYQRALSFGQFGAAAAESVLMLLTIAVIFALGTLVVRASRSRPHRTEGPAS